MSFRFIFSNTATLAPLPYGYTHVQGSAEAQRMPAMIVQTDLDNLSLDASHAHAVLRFNRE